MNLEGKTDEEIVLEAKNNGYSNLVAGILVTKYREQLYKIARKIRGNHDEAEDIIQDMYFNLATSGLKSYDSSYRVFPWLYKIVVRNAYGHFRASCYSKNNFNCSTLASKEEIIGLPSLSPEELFIKAEDEQIVRKGLNFVQEKYRAFLELYYFENMTQHEIARRIGITQQGVYDKIRKGER